MRAALATAVAIVGFGLAIAPAGAGNTTSGIKAVTGALKKQLPVASGNPVARRHLECAVYPATALATLNLPVGSIGTPSMVVITNNGQSTIPGGTTYTYTVAGSSYTSTDTDNVAPGGHFLIGFDASSQMPCDATVPG